MTATLDQQLAYIRLRLEVANQNAAFFKLPGAALVIKGRPSEHEVLLSIEKTLLIEQAREKILEAMADHILHPTPSLFGEGAGGEALHPSPERTIATAKQDPLI